MAVFGRLRMPSLGGATGWLNSEPLGPAELQGRVVLFNFWTLTCINWLRQEPYVRAWSQAYRDDGLIVIGVHTPEFSFEHEIERVRQATKERAIDYPVALDNDYGVWRPSTTLLAGSLLRRRGGRRSATTTSAKDGTRNRSGHPAAAGRRKRACLRQGLGVEAEADWANLRTSETYLGSAQRDSRTRGAGCAGLRAPDSLSTTGRSPASGRSGARSRARPGRRRDRLPLPRSRRPSRALTRRARADSLPRAPRRRGSGPVTRRRRRRGREGTARRGPDVPARATARRIHERTLEITFLEPGAEAYVFTFG